MTIKTFKDYQSMSAACAADFLKMIPPVENPVICTASGDSPRGMYQELLEMIIENNINTESWNFLSLDEWIGINGNDEGSCRFHLNNDLFNPLHIKEDKITFFDGRSQNTDAECERIESFIDAQNGIDIAIVGLGLNGHVGMNEPGTSENSRTRVSEIDKVTQEVGQKYFQKEQQLTHGITLGIANLMQAKRLIMIVSGIKKAAVVQQILEHEISTQLPASLLRNHKNFWIYLDEEAASLLQKN